MKWVRTRSWHTFTLANGTELSNEWTVFPVDADADAAEAAAAALGIPVQVSLTDPDDPSSEIPFAWGLQYPITPSVTVTTQGEVIGDVGITPQELFDAHSPARATPGTRLYVSPTGSDANNGTSEATPFRSLWKAVAAGNATGLPTRVLVAPGTYSRVNSFKDPGSSVAPEVDMAFIAGGRVTTGNFDDGSGFAADATHTNTYTKAVANCHRVLDLAETNRYGNHVEYRQVATAAACNARPGSWALVGGTLYVNRLDGKAPSVANLRYFRDVTNFVCVADVNLYFGPDAGAEGFDLQGGTASGVMVVSPTSPQVDKVLVVANTSARYGGPVAGAANGFSVNNRRGLAAFFNCRADANAKDGFNVHHVGAGVSRLLTVNCSAADNGREGQSCNSWTLHEACLGVDVAGVYRDSAGGNVHNIGSSKAYLLGTVVDGDRGDIAHGGGIYPTGVKTGDTAQVWAERVTVLMPPGGFPYAAQSGSAIRRRGTAPSRLPDHGAGTFGTF